jgi:ribosomal protein L32
VLDAEKLKNINDALLEAMQPFDEYVRIDTNFNTLLEGHRKRPRLLIASFSGVIIRVAMSSHPNSKSYQYEHRSCPHCVASLSALTP